MRVTRILRGRHFKLFGRVAKHTKPVGVGASKLLRLIIKYLPKYILFFRNMKAVVALRILRQVKWFNRVWNIFGKRTSKRTKNAPTSSLSTRAKPPSPPTAETITSNTNTNTNLILKQQIDKDGVEEEEQIINDDWKMKHKNVHNNLNGYEWNFIDEDLDPF